MEAAGSRVKVQTVLTGDAVGYVDAMHGLCVGCHEQLEKEEPAKHPADFALCRNCHRDVDGDRDRSPRALPPGQPHVDRCPPGRVT